MNAEEQRLRDGHNRVANWQRWGPYLAERQWGTVREDYSEDGNCWNYFPFDHAHLRTYRWGEDGLLGITDRECRLCFAVALWNGNDAILKERLFGLNSHEGNHGEDVKECYHYLESTPTHSYMKALYRYPQAAFPYDELRRVNRHRGREEPEFELADTGVFDDGRYFDVTAEYAKNAPDDILINLTIANRGPAPAAIHVLPTLWFRNTWIWGCRHEGCWIKPDITLAEHGLRTRHQSLEPFTFAVDNVKGVEPQWLFTENETNTKQLYGSENYTPYVKDACHRYLIDGDRDAVNPKPHGTRAAACFALSIGAQEEVSIRCRLTAADTPAGEAFGDGFKEVLEQRIAEHEEFYAAHCPGTLGDDERRISRQAYAGLLWSKQFYHYVVENWLDGDPDQPAPPAARQQGRNHDWRHLYNRDVISMPDKWEYPWYASWDLAFHMIPFAEVDPEFAKGQLLTFLREWYMHPNGQIPAYEFALGDVNPPVHAWAAWRVYKIADRDIDFLRRVFQKLLMNFTWWVNRKDPDGNHVFAGGFLGMDNIGVFDRSKPTPDGGELEQADGTAWMAFYCATMLEIALEIAAQTGDAAAEDLASKFFEHFIAIADACNGFGGTGLWDETDGFYYDQLLLHGERLPLKVRSLVGVIPLLAADVLHQDVIDRLPGFGKRLQWFLTNRPDLAGHISYLEPDNTAARHRLLAIPSRERLERVLSRLFDETEFLSPFGIRSLSKTHAADPFVFRAGGQEYSVGYSPGDSNTNMFGGNSNWRGPIWFPMNFLIIEALERYHHFYGDELLVEFPTGSGARVNLKVAAERLAARLIALFRQTPDGLRPALGAGADPDLLLFHEFFHGDTGKGLGASHQTGWTALVTKLLQKCHRE